MEHAELSPQEISLFMELGRAAKACLQAEGACIELLGQPGAEMLECSTWAVMPASFNPPTLAHQEMLNWALTRGGFHKALVLLDLRHADKATHQAHLLDRYAMVRLALLQDNTATLALASRGRFLDKAQALAGLFPEGTSWSFLVGMDTLARVLEPKFYQEPSRDLQDLFSRASFLVFERPGWSHVSLPEGLQGRIRLARLPEPLREISSSNIRMARQLGLPWKHQVTPQVAEFIERTGLYLGTPDIYEPRRKALERLMEEAQGG